jgi:hypothetical protein
MKDLRQELIDNKIDISEYDVIIGYRADDSYFSYIREFLDNRMYIETLEQSMKLGDLGIQICIKSKKAYDRLHEIFPIIEVKSISYLKRFRQRGEKAKKDFETLEPHGKTFPSDFIKKKINENK